MIVFDVLGTPAPKGSGRAMLIAGRARHVPSGSTANQRALKAWDVAVREAAADAIGPVGPTAAPPYVATPLVLAITFRMARPAGHWGTGRHAGRLRPSAPSHPISAPDSSKLVRATEDSLTGIVWDDDSRVGLHVIDRVFAVPGNEGATIAVCARTELGGPPLAAQIGVLLGLADVHLLGSPVLPRPLPLARSPVARSHAGAQALLRLA